MKESLPIDEALPRLLAALRDSPAVVLEAPPGAGKTTRVPPALLDVVDGEIVVLEPRRIAARAAARRVQAEGTAAGYQIRFDKSGPRDARIWFVTEGILARRLIEQPSLPGVGAVILDEFHERHLQGDLALALAQRLLPRVKLVAMSATLDAAPLAAHLRAPVVRSEGRRFEVAVEHLAQADARPLGQQVSAAVRRLTIPDAPPGDVLVFLPGGAEIRQGIEACAALGRDLLLLPLHGDLSGDEQDRALQPARQRKIILSTNVAETSVTVPGVTAVVDSGLARIASHSPWSGLPSLNVAKISRASALQRAGRAGRTGPGRALRLYTRHDFEARPDHHPPEIERHDLAGMLLELRGAEIDPDALHWLDAPPPLAMQLARRLLQRIGALDDQERATAVGRACARLPLHPRLARVVVEAARLGFSDDGAALAALISERRAGAAEDVISLLDQGRPEARLQQQLARLAPAEGPRTMKRDEAIALAVLAGFPDRVARRRGSEVLLAGGGAALLPHELAAMPELLVAVEAEERRDRGRARTFVRIAAPIEPELLLESAREESALAWSDERERVEQVTRLLYDQLVLDETRRPAHAPEILLQHASGIPDPESISALRARAEIAGVALRDLEAARRSVAGRVASLAEFREADFAAELLAPEDRARLDQLAPESVTLPGGRKVRVEYAAGQPPAIRSRLQDFFGMKQTPAVAGGRVPLTLHLLAPNGRAQQVTQDLAGFWERHYPAVRRELMRKYPRHAWPENGAAAQPPSVNRRPQR